MTPEAPACAAKTQTDQAPPVKGNPQRQQVPHQHVKENPKRQPARQRKPEASASGLPTRQGNPTRQRVARQHVKETRRVSEWPASTSMKPEASASGPPARQ